LLDYVDRISYDEGASSSGEERRTNCNFQLRVDMNFLCIASALLLWPIPVAVQGIGSVTLLEGSLRLVRGTGVSHGAEGMRLQQGDILESSDKGFVQLEFAGGTVVALGPSTRFYIFKHAAGRSNGKTEGAPASDFVLLSGWLKAESSGGGGSYRYETVALAATSASGTVVIHSHEGECDMFVESGSAAVAEVSPDGSSHQPTVAKAGQFFSRRAGKNLTTLDRPNPAFLDVMPAAFRDTLPSRLAHFADKSVEPNLDHPVAYGELQPWLTMPSAWRRGLVDRFASRLKDPEFRRQVEAHLAGHPEWDPILHPKKDSPETPPA
jgi:hypothetical protein